MATSTEDTEAISEDLNRKYHELSEEFSRTSNLEVLLRGLGFIQQAVGKTASGPLSCSDVRAGHLNNLGRCQRMLFQATGDTSHLENAIDAGRLSLVAVPASSTLRALCYSNLSDTLSKCYFAKGAKNRSDFEDAIEMARVAVASSSEDSKYHSGAQSTLASRLGEYFEFVDSDDKYLNEAIQICQSLVQKTPKIDDMYGVYVLNLAVELKNRFGRYGDIVDLLSAKEYFGNAIDAFPPSHTNHAMAVRMFAEAEADLADTTNNPEGLEDALQALLSLESNLKSSDDLAKLGHTKSRLYNQKYQMFSTIDDLNLAVEAAEGALSRLPSDSALRGAFLQSLGNRLAARAQVRMSVRDMDAAINCAMQSLELASGVPAQQANAYNALGNTLSTKFDLFGGLQCLSNSLDARRSALRLLPQDHKDRPTRLHGVANSLRDHFKHYGAIAYLNESIELEREAANSIAKSDPDRSMILQGLSFSLTMRSGLTGNSQDMEEAVSASQAAVAGSLVGNASRPSYLNELSNRLISRFDRYHNNTDLDKAISVISEAISASAGDSSSEIVHLTTLSNSLSSRYNANGDVHDLDMSIEAGRKVVAKVPMSNPSRISCLYNLGLRLQMKYDCSTDKEEKHRYLKEAYDISVQCVNGTPENHPDLPDYLKQLATRQLYLALFMDDSDESKLLEQLKLSATTFEEAFRKTYATPLNRIRNGELGGYMYMQLKDWDAASRILSESVNMFQQASPLSLDENDRQRQLRGLSGISSLACAAFIALGKPESGLEILEAGRGIMANIAMRYHDDLTNMKHANPELHARYVALRDSISHSLQERETASSHGQDLVAKRNAELAELKTIERRIRCFPGLRSFNQGPSAEQLRELAVHGPLVSFCTVDQRCDAVIVTSTAIQTLPLPELRHSEIKKRIGMVVSASRLSKMVPSRRPLANRRMRGLLGWLWDMAVRPVLKHLELLQDTESVPKIRLWWVTSGPMGLLPLHAAGKGYKAPLQNVYAHVVSSYIPSFSSLAFARRCQAKVDIASSTMALITMPQTAGELAHLSTEDESQAIREAFRSSRSSNGAHLSSTQLIELCQPSATEVLDHVCSNNVDMLHFACHAEPDLNDPSNTSLLFGSDPNAHKPDPLAVRELIRIQNSSRSDQRPLRLAYLSACCTAQQYDLRLIDENIHLAAAFQLSGFPAVIGTLWEADDVAAVVIARAFYEELFRLDQTYRSDIVESQSGYHVAKALHFASAACRQRQVGRGNAAEDVLAWASFVHIGA